MNLVRDQVGSDVASHGSRLVHNALSDAMAADPDLPWLRFISGKTFTLAELHERVRRLGAGLQQRGVARGDRVAIMTSNTVEFVETWFAVHLVGGISVPLNTAFRGDVLAHMLCSAAPSVIVVERALLNRIMDAIEPDFGGMIAVIGGDPTDSSRPWTEIDYSDLAIDAAPRPVPLTERDPASIMFTSGTTGPSKGVVWTHGSTWHMAEVPARSHGYGPGDTLYVCLPLFHATALVTLLFAGLISSSRIVIADRFSVSRFWSDVRESRATATSFLGAMAPLLLAQPPTRTDRDHRLRTGMVVPAPVGTAEAFRSRFGFDIIHAYGLSDFGWICWPQHGEVVPDGSVGRVHESFEARIVDDEDNALPAGQVGEMVARPRRPWTAPSGYWEMPVETLESQRNLWFHTGDLMSRDANGYFYFVDRAKDAMRRRGENVSSFEVERAVSAHAAVQECAAYALPSDLAEDEIAVAVVLRPDAPAPSPDELIAFVEPRLPYFAVPRYVRILQALPKTQTEKIQKHLLRSEGVTEDTWDAVRAGVVVAR
jgi:crotonobetaine/carnitine-CoA ligase